MKVTVSMAPKWIRRPQTPPELDTLTAQIIHLCRRLGTSGIIDLHRKM